MLPFKTKSDTLLYYSVLYYAGKICNIVVELKGKLNITVNYDLELYCDFLKKDDDYQNISFI